uniref:GDSL esterase/lipase n=1 Tax=Aegilops tauschii subsp. strangulata TaxID=200361 RepID=A0A453F500_AEGTS
MHASSNRNWHGFLCLRLRLRERRRLPLTGRGAASGGGDTRAGGSRGAVRSAGVQLRGLAGGHGQLPLPLRQRLPRARAQDALRGDILPPRHRPLLRRPPHRRLHRGHDGAAVRAAVPERANRGGLRVRGQLRGRRRHGAGPGLLSGERGAHGRPHAPWRRDEMVPRPARSALPRRPGREKFYWHRCEVAAGSSNIYCMGMMNQSLFLVGEIGGNDYNIPLLSRVPFEKIRTFTPSVVAKISSTVTELIGLGAKTLVVPGNLPIGCVPNYLMIFKSDKKEDYEPETGCLRWMN